YEILAGEIFGIIGTSGSGKSTMLNSLVGFLKVDKGDILFRNSNLLNADDAASYRSIYKHQKELKRIYGFASQNPSFYPNLSVGENLKYFGALYNLPKESIASNITYLLNLVGLTQSQHVIAKKLSGGMARRLDIACALIHDPKILFLDEPTADLDPVMGNKIWNLLRIINQRGTTIILASHHIVEIEQLCDRVAIIKDGKIRALGDPEQIKSKNLPKEMIYMKSSPGMYKKIITRIKRACPGTITKAEMKNKRLEISANTEGCIVPALLSIAKDMNENVLNIESVKPKLDQAFIMISTESTRRTAKRERKEKRAAVKKKAQKRKLRRKKKAALTSSQMDEIDKRMKESQQNETVENN
ncbi:TPA: ABC transporter ATP-binding protein, partial [Candidatus Woesearchaeota archaeon]|nr:ABC transporter ATP-binding protein [Candidatus Woesearchaeota archaeon]